MRARHPEVRVTDRIVLADMGFEARHGVNDWEQREAQRFEVDVELDRDLAPAGVDDDLAATVDYGPCTRPCAGRRGRRPSELLEALAEAIAGGRCSRTPPSTEVVVRVRKPEVRLGGPLDYAGVEIRAVRRRGPPD